MKIQFPGGNKSGGSRLLALVFFLIVIMGAVQVLAPSGSTAARTRPAMNSAVSDSTYVPMEISTPGLAGHIWKVVAVTAAIIGFFWLTARLYRRKMMPDFHKGGRFEVLGREHLSPKNYLVMVRVEGRKLLLGVTDMSVNMLAEFDESEEFDSKGTDLKATETGFAGILQRVFDKGGSQGAQDK